MSVHVGGSFGSDVRLTEKEIIEAARFIGDENPIHHSLDHGNERFEGVIASGSPFSGLFSALVPSYFSKYGQALGLDMSFQFCGPIHPDETYKLNWKVVSVSWNAKLNGDIYKLIGTVIATDETLAMKGEVSLVLFRSG